MYKYQDHGLSGIPYGSEIIAAVMGWTGPSIYAAVAASEQFKNQVNSAISVVVNRVRDQYGVILNDVKISINKASAELQVLAVKEVDRIVMISKERVRQLGKEGHRAIDTVQMMNRSFVGHGSAADQLISDLELRIQQRNRKLINLQQRIKRYL